MQVRHAWYSDDMHGVSPGKKEQPMAAFVYVNSDSRNAVCVCVYFVDGWLRSLHYVRGLSQSGIWSREKAKSGKDRVCGDGKVSWTKVTWAEADGGHAVPPGPS